LVAAQTPVNRIDRVALQCEASAMTPDQILKPPASAAELRSRIVALEMERLEAIEAGLGSNAAYMHDLETELGHHRNAYVGMAVTEIATLRGQLDGPLVG
jgi:hypothetical protein